MGLLFHLDKLKKKILREKNPWKTKKDSQRSDTKKGRIANEKYEKIDRSPPQIKKVTEKFWKNGGKSQHTQLWGIRRSPDPWKTKKKIHSV